MPAEIVLALSIIQSHRASGPCAFLNARHSVDPGSVLGGDVNIDKLPDSQPDHCGQALEITRLLV